MRTLISTLALALIAASASAKEPDPFARQKAAFAAKLKNKAPAVRLDAARKLAEFSGPDAAQLLWQFALKDPDSDVRWAAYDTLLSYRGSRESVLAMLEQVEIGLTQTRQEATAAWLLGAVLAADDAGIRAQLDAALAKASERSAVRVAILLSETLASRATVDEVLPLSRLAKTQLSARVFGVRRAAVQGLLAIPHRDAVAALVDLLPNLRGEIRADVPFSSTTASSPATLGTPSSS